MGCRSDPCDVGQSHVMWVSPLWCRSDPCDVGQSLVVWASPLWWGSVPCDMGQSLVMWVSPLWCKPDPCDVGQSSCNAGQSCVMWVSPISWGSILYMWVRPFWCGSVFLWIWLNCALTCSGCSPNTMDIVSGSVGDVVVNYQVHCWNVQTSETSGMSTQSLLVKMQTTNFHLLEEEEWENTVTTFVITLSVFYHCFVMIIFDFVVIS